MLAGDGGFEFQGETYNSSVHTSSTVIMDEGCVICHMSDPNAGTGIGGGHTMNIRYEGTHGEEQELLTGCTTTGCHSATNFSLDYKNGQSETHELLDSLQNLLIARDWIYDDGEGYLVNAGSSSPRGSALKITPAFLSGAMFNYFFVEHDLSLGVHNTAYTHKLLETSIDALNAN
jgi:hypothetical protein